MNELEKRIRELPLPGPSAVLNARMAKLFCAARAPGVVCGSESRTTIGRTTIGRTTVASPIKLAIAAALAAGLAGFAAGVGTAHWLAPGPAEKSVAGGANGHGEPTPGPEQLPIIVQLTDARITAGLDFSRSVEPFRVQPADREGS